MTRQQAKRFIGFWSAMQRDINEHQNIIQIRCNSEPGEACLRDLLSLHGQVDLDQLNRWAREWQGILYEAMDSERELTPEEQKRMLTCAQLRHNYIEDLISYGNRMLEVIEEDDEAESGEDMPCAF